MYFEVISLSLIVWIKQWVGNVIALVFLAMLLELLLPRSSMQRFVRVVMGMLVMLAVLQPVFGLLSHGLGLEGLGAAVSGPSLNIDRILADAESLRQQNSDLTLAAYRQQVEQNIEQRLTTLPGVRSATCRVEVVADKTRQDYGAIASVAVTVMPGEPAGSGQSGAAGVAPVEPVVIGQRQAEAVPAITAELKALLVRTLVADFGLTAEQITIAAGGS